MHGLHSHGFPNCFIMGPQQSGFTVNFPHMLDEQAKHIAYLISEVQARGAATVEVTVEAEQAWVDTILAKAVFGRDFQESCTPGYYNNEGKVTDLAAQNGFYGGGNLEFFALLDAWREKGELEGLELK
jgi:cyclohexanone monooxygenase